MKVGVLGAGQLGRMLAIAGYPLGHQFGFSGNSQNEPSSLLRRTRDIKLIKQGLFTTTMLRGE
jgi:phosphoribosylaminoimidazole carboxylase (NCAIR synthetase)